MALHVRLDVEALAADLARISMDIESDASDTCKKTMAQFNQAIAIWLLANSAPHTNYKLEWFNFSQRRQRSNKRS
jgi:hypothetical protein